MKNIAAGPTLFATLLEENKQISQLILKHARCARQVAIFRLKFFVSDLNLEMAPLKAVVQIVFDCWSFGCSHGIL